MLTQDLIKCPYPKSKIRLAQILERVGYFEDYLDDWVKKSFDCLKDLVEPDDILFATSGGELAGIKLASLLKTHTNCRFVINLHDPVDYTLVAGLKIDRKPHVSRERQERKYFGNTDMVITSSDYNRLSLADKYPELNERIRTSYFGYLSKVEPSHKHDGERLSIVYGGTFDRNQSPEILAEAVMDLEGVEAHFVGRHGSYRPLNAARTRPKNFQFHDQMPYPVFLEFMRSQADLGFASLASDYLGACVPSKIFEMINIGLPVIGALPEGDARNLVNSRGFGVALSYDDINGIRNILSDLRDNRNKLADFRQNLLWQRDAWHMPHRMMEMLEWLRTI